MLKKIKKKSEKFYIIKNYNIFAFEFYVPSIKPIYLVFQTDSVSNRY